MLPYTGIHYTLVPCRTVSVRAGQIVQNRMSIHGKWNGCTHLIDLVDLILLFEENGLSTKLKCIFLSFALDCRCVCLVPALANTACHCDIVSLLSNANVKHKYLQVVIDSRFWSSTILDFLIAKIAKNVLFDCKEYLTARKEYLIISTPRKK